MYVLEVDHAEEWLEPLRQLCATPDRRNALRASLTERQSHPRRSSARPSSLGGVDHPERDLVQTGIAGLDDLLAGCVRRGSVVLVEGPTGTGKTTMGVEFIYRGATEFSEPGLIVLFEVSPDKLVRDAALSGWDLPELERQGRLKIVFTTRQVFQQEVQQADSLLLDEAAAIGARRIFVNGLVRRTPKDSAGGNTPEVFHLLAEGLQRKRLTAIIGAEVAAAGDAGLGASLPEEFIADTVVHLTVEAMSVPRSSRSRS
jgi:circadian clock protein KaiC